MDTESPQPIRVLLLDDEPSLVDGLRRALRKTCPHWDVETFNLPDRALRRAESSLFDVFISDFRMPGMNGAEFLLGAREAQPESVRIILSGQLDVPDIVKALNKSRIDRLVLKPTGANELAAVVNSALEVRRVRVENRRLADEVRRQRAMLKQQQSVIENFATRHPELLNVERADDGSIVVDDWQ